MINILICDDNKDFLVLIKKYIDEVILSGKYSDFEYKTECFTDSDFALCRCVETPPEISFLDIDMPNPNGFEIAEKIHERNPNAIIIFITGYENYVYSSFRYQPLRFLRKSCIDKELSEALNCALTKLLCKNKYLELGNKYLNERVLISDILYFESKRNYAEIVCDDNKRYLYRSTLSQLETKLKNYGFLRIHAAYLVNMSYIVKIYKDTVFLINDTQLKISRRFNMEVQRSYSEYLRR